MQGQKNCYTLVVKLVKKFLAEKELLTLLIIACISRILFLAKWMDDWDSIQFALGLHEYSIPKHQPHPPGYPIYILFGRFFNLFLHNDTFSLTLMSAIFGTLAIIPLYLLLKQIFNQKRSALIGIAMFLITPVVWLLSESALTDIVGLFFLILTAFLLYIYVNNPKAIVWVSFLAGLTIGVRFNEFPIVLVLLVWVMFKQKNLKYASFQFLALTLGGLIWLVPMILITGWSQFITTFTTNGTYVEQHDALLGTSHSIPGLIKAKTLLMVPLFNWGYSTAFSIIFFICFAATAIQRKLYKQNWFQFVLIWLISYFLLLFTFYNLELPRHIMPLVVPMIIVTLYITQQLIAKNKLFWIFPIVLIGVLLYQSLSQVYRFHNAMPATIGSVLYVKSHFNPQNTVIYASYTLRNFQYYAPAFKSLDNTGDKSVFTPDKTIITDLVDLNRDPALTNFKEVDTQYFSAPKDIFPKVDSIQLHILKYKAP